MRAAIATPVAAVAVAFCLSSAAWPAQLPWKATGLTETQAAAHLLNRFAHGSRPGEVEKVVAMGLDRWFERQLAGGLPDAPGLSRLPALDMSPEELARTYPPPGIVLAEARRAGVLPEDVKPGNVKEGEREALREKVRQFARARGYRPQRELLGQLMTQKLLRAVGSENQLAEVMTDFWFNHFNVSLTDNKSRLHLLSYERDAIRPHALGRFRDLLGASARHPAMLLYLDNARSSAAMEASATMGRGFGMQRMRPRGINENYARELLELHTLGVEGGYTQKDVAEVARAFTGWTVLPRTRRAGGLGFQTEGGFLFRADFHDAGEKTVLGTRLPAGRGIEDGEAVLDLLARHPSTARHLAAKLAARFVSDQPPPALVDRLAGVYLETGGDIRALLAALAQSPEFWSREAVGAKVKSPFELAASALRALDARVTDPREILRWISQMGQPLYAYQAPTGYPDRAEAWVNTGSLLNRMNFGLQLAAGRIRGIEFDLPALSGGREPGSRDEALRVYAGLLMPGRDLAATLKLLGPMVSDPQLAKRVDETAPREEKTKKRDAMDEDDAVFGTDPEMREKSRSIIVSDKLREPEPVDRVPPTPLEQVVGVILGSPEFQRR